MKTFNFNRFKGYLKKGNIHYFFKRYSQIVVLQLSSNSGSIVHLKKFKSGWEIISEFSCENEGLNVLKMAEYLLSKFTQNDSLPGPLLVILPGYQSVIQMRRLGNNQSIKRVIEAEKRQFPESIIHTQLLEYTDGKNLVISKTSKAFLTQFNTLFQKYSILVAEYVTYIDFWTQAIEHEVFDFNVSAYTLVSDIQAQKHHLFVIRNHKLCFYRSVAHVDWIKMNDSEKQKIIENDILDTYQLIKKTIPNCQSLAWYCQSTNELFNPANHEFITSSNPLKILNDIENNGLQVKSIPEEVMDAWIKTSFQKSKAFINQRKMLFAGFWIVLMLSFMSVMISITISTVALYDYRIDELNSQFDVLSQTDLEVFKKKKDLESKLKHHSKLTNQYSTLINKVDDWIPIGYLLDYLSIHYSSSIHIHSIAISEKDAFIDGTVIFKDSYDTLPGFVQILGEMPFVKSSEFKIYQARSDKAALTFRVKIQRKRFQRISL